MPMTHAPETGAINPFLFSGADFCYVCHADVGPDSSGARFRHRLEVRTLFYSKPVRKKVARA